MGAVLEITKEFRFDAAHFLPGMPPGHAYRRMHGHSFRVAVTLAGTPDPETGWIADFSEIEAALTRLRDALDHTTLNDLPGLANPTLELIAGWIAARLVEVLPTLRRVSLHRDSVGETCTLTLQD
ncbi:MAG TPA: 6-carboxytetrahydropterin synthase QueD [Stellaceae bacterium]|nr:6-carboxytetrahydropterin synthase QueD [Stellaceae bacterium]